MKSIVRKVLEKTTVEEKPLFSKGQKFGDYEVDKVELERVLKTLKANIKIIGIGGAGSNTIDRIVSDGIVGANLIAINTDAQHLLNVKAQHKMLIGRRVTRGLGAGALPQVGEQAAIEAEEEVKNAVIGSDIVFVTTGLGGGTGTGATPVVAKIAKDSGALTIAVVTKPFKAEGKARMENAESGITRLRNSTDTVIVIPNDKLLEIVPRLPLNAAFKVADEILMKSIKGITELLTKPGLVNLDFNDLKTIMKGGGVSMIGMGEAEAEDRAIEAVNEALNSPLLDVDITGATGALVNVLGGPDMTVSEAEQVVDEISKRINPEARIIWGAAVEESMKETISVMIVVTGVTSDQIKGPTSGIKNIATSFGIDTVR